MTGKQDLFPDFTSDCSACAALCCIALHFDAGHGFGFDKSAGDPCPNLNRCNFGCSVHKSLPTLGFSGCVSFECKGAGPRTIQEVFDGQNWRDRPDLLPDIMEAFRILRKLHEALEILSLIRLLPLTETQNSIYSDLMNSLASPETGWDLPSLRELEKQGALRRYKSELPNFQTALKTPNALAALRAAS